MPSVSLYDDTGAEWGRVALDEVGDHAEARLLITHPAPSGEGPPQVLHRHAERLPIPMTMHEIKADIEGEGGRLIGMVKAALRDGIWSHA